MKNKKAKEKQTLSFNNSNGKCRNLTEKSYIKIGGFLKINLLIIPVFYAAVRFGYLNLILTAYITALLHESFHMGAMKILKIPVKELIFQPFGLCAATHQTAFDSSKKELAVALAGPFFNFFAAAFFLIFKPFVPFEKYRFFITLNLAMGIFNLIPALPLDGGRALKSILTMHFGVIRAYNFMLCLSKIIIFFILFSSCALLLYAPFNFQLILTGVFLLCNLSAEQSTLSKIILSDILNKKFQKNTNTPIPIKHFAANKNSPARQILKLLSFDYTVEMSVLDTNGKLLCHLSESEIINFLIKNGIRAKFDDLRQK